MKRIGQLNVHKYSIKRNPNSPIYEFDAHGKVSECFNNGEEPEIKLNDSIFNIQEIKPTKMTNPDGSIADVAINVISDSYEVLVTYVEKFTTDNDNNFHIVFEGKRLNHPMSTTIIEPAIVDIIRYNTALLLVVACDVSQFKSENGIPTTPEARSYLSKMKLITHLGILYHYVAMSFIAIKTDMPNRPEDIQFINNNLILVYSSKEIPVQEDLDTVKHIYHRKMFPKY